MFFPQSKRGVKKLLNLDRSFLGSSDDYMGIAYFWNYEYRHWLRDVSNYRRRLVHAAFIRERLDLAGESNKHLEIIKRYCQGRT